MLGLQVFWGASDHSGEGFKLRHMRIYDGRSFRVSFVCDFGQARQGLAAEFHLHVYLLSSDLRHCSSY